MIGDREVGQDPHEDVGVGKPDDVGVVEMLVHGDAVGTEHVVERGRDGWGRSRQACRRDRTAGRQAGRGHSNVLGDETSQRPVAGSGDHESRFGREQREKPAHRGRGNGDAALGRREAWPRDMQENSAAAALDGGPAVPVELDHEIVKRVVPPEAFVAGRERQRDAPVVARVARVVAPALIGPDRPRWQEWCVRTAVFGAKHELNGPQRACGRRRRRPRACALTHASAAQRAGQWRGCPRRGGRAVRSSADGARGWSKGACDARIGLSGHGCVETAACAGSHAWSTCSISVV